jgi:hypothetical protein
MPRFAKSRLADFSIAMGSRLSLKVIGNLQIWIRALLPSFGYNT